MGKLTVDKKAIDKVRGHKPELSGTRYQLSLLAVLLLSALSTVQAQQREVRDSIPTHRLDSIGMDAGEDVIEIESYAAQFDPRKALLYSAVLPGAGQMYNRAYWKVPIIWGGFVAMGYGIKAYHDYYVMYKGMLYRLLNEPTPLVFDPDTGETPSGNRVINGKLVAYPYNLGIETLRQRVSRFQRDRDFAVMLTGLWYILQAVEAHVDAHLKEFKVNPQLKVMVEPSINSSYMTGRTSGFSLTLRF